MTCLKSLTKELFRAERVIKMGDFKLSIPPTGFEEKTFSFYHLLEQEQKPKKRERIKWQKISAENSFAFKNSRLWKQWKSFCRNFHVTQQRTALFHSIVVPQSCRHDYKLLLFKKNSIFFYCSAGSILLAVNLRGKRRREKM